MYTQQRLTQRYKLYQWTFSSACCYHFSYLIANIVHLLHHNCSTAYPIFKLLNNRKSEITGFMVLFCAWGHEWMILCPWPERSSMDTGAAAQSAAVLGTTRGAAALWTHWNNTQKWRPQLKLWRQRNHVTLRRQQDKKPCNFPLEKGNYRPLQQLGLLGSWWTYSQTVQL